MPEPNSPPVDVPHSESPAAHAPVARTKEPTTRAPIGACDAHLALPGGISDPTRGATAGLHGFEDWLTNCRDHLDSLGCTRGVIVSRGAEVQVTIDAVRRLGDAARGVVAVDPDVQEHTLDQLAHHRIRGVQVDLTRAAPLDWAGATALAPRLAAREMHLEVALHADSHLPRLTDEIAALPVPVVIEHCGWPEGTTSSVGMQSLYRLLAEGHAWVKLSAAERAGGGRAGAAALISGLVGANAERCVWGSDWPHLQAEAGEQPDSGVLFDAFNEIVADVEVRQRILVDNPATLYGFAA